MDPNTVRSPTNPLESEGLDRQSLAATQDEPAWGAGTTARSRLRLRTLITLRWSLVTGQALLLFASSLGYGFVAPYGYCAGLIGLSMGVNLIAGLASPRQRLTGPWEATGHLAFDILQCGGLLYLTGGIQNPFALFLIAPVTLAAATLSLGPVCIVGGLAVLTSLCLALLHHPIEVLPGTPILLPANFIMAASIANIIGILTVAGSVWQSAQESARMSLALDVTRRVLSREQRLSALGGLAAAAAHELGTPLATISIVAGEMARDAAASGTREDAELLVAQAARCREILKRLTDSPSEASDAVHERLSLRQLLQEVVEPLAEIKGVRIEAIVTGSHGLATPDVRRMPELLHALTTFSENAVDFAQSEVLLIARFDQTHISVDVRDDGPGFPQEILSRLGEPYVSSRAGFAFGRTGHVGMGLGFFIAKTLLERTGAKVSAENAKPHGALISVKWLRDQIEARPT